MKKIIHLSDLHVGSGRCTGVFSNVVQNIIEKMTPADDYIIVITGDLVDNAHNGYCIVRHRIDRLKKCFEGRVLIVPGNHDYGNGNEGYRGFVQDFKDAFIPPDLFINNQYPTKKIIDNIAFIGLDSGEDAFREGLDLAYGKLGDDQLGRLKKMLNEDEVMACDKKVVYLHHQPLPYLLVPGHFLRDRKELKTEIEGKIDALLFGHRHVYKSWFDKWGIQRMYNAGASAGKGKDDPHRIIDLSMDPSSDETVSFY